MENCREAGTPTSVILSAAKDLMPIASGDEVLRCAQDDKCGPGRLPRSQILRVRRQHCWDYARRAPIAPRRILIDGSGLSRHFERAVVVAVLAVRVMQVAVDQVVDMIAMRHRGMAAARPVPV